MRLRVEGAGSTSTTATLETTQGQMDGFFSQLLFKCYLPEVASLCDLLKICPWVVSRVVCTGKQSYMKREFK